MVFVSLLTLLQRTSSTGAFNIDRCTACTLCSIIRDHSRVIFAGYHDSLRKTRFTRQFRSARSPQSSNHPISLSCSLTKKAKKTKKYSRTTHGSPHNLVYRSRFLYFRSVCVQSFASGYHHSYTTAFSEPAGWLIYNLAWFFSLLHGNKPSVSSLDNMHFYPFETRLGRLEVSYDASVGPVSVSVRLLHHALRER